MNTIHFLCGMGFGALLTTVFFLILLVILFRYMGRTRTELQERADKQHADLVELHRDRNNMVADMLKSALTIEDWVKANFSK